MSNWEERARGLYRELVGRMVSREIEDINTQEIAAELSTAFKEGRALCRKEMLSHGAERTRKMFDLEDALAEATAELKAAREEQSKAGSRQDSLQRALSEANDGIRSMAKELTQAVSLIRQGKARFAPNTTNSHVDDFLAKYDALLANGGSK